MVPSGALASPGGEDPPQGPCMDGTPWGTHEGALHVPRDRLTHGMWPLLMPRV